MPQKIKQEPSIRNLHAYSVHGFGRFPFDMLRYDSCWPRTGDDVVAIGVDTERGVRLIGIRPPTEGRWSSFGWTVE